MPAATRILRASWPRPGALPAAVWLQIAMLLCLIFGAFAHHTAPMQAAAGLAVIWIATQWGRLIRLARVFFALAIGLGVIALWHVPAAGAQLAAALVQGTGFAALMMVLGLLRQPVRRAQTTRSATEYLLAFPPQRRFAALFAGAHVMALMFNVGIIAMIGDLTEPRDGRDVRHDPARRAMVMAAMRGAATVSIWSPIGLGFAIVSAGLPTLDPLRLICCAVAFSALALALGARWPLLPTEARMPRDAAPGGNSGGAGRALAATLAISALLLGLTYAMHRGLGVGFTIASVTVLPVFALIWLGLESRHAEAGFGPRLVQALRALGDLRSESAIFLSANVIGVVLSMALQASPLWAAMIESRFAGLPLALGCLVAVPLAAALYLPNSIVVVVAAQLLGGTPLGLEHPVALGLALCIGWGLAICVSPISAMTLIAGRLCATSSRRVAHHWNMPYAATLLFLGAGAVCLAYRFGL